MAVESAPADHCVRQMYQRLVNVIPLLVAHPQAAEPLLPTNRPLDHPTVATQPHAALDPAPREARRDAPLAQLLTQDPVVIRLVGMQLRATLPRATALATHRGNRYRLRLNTEGSSFTIPDVPVPVFRNRCLKGVFPAVIRTFNIC